PVPVPSPIRSFPFTSTATPQFYTLSLHDALPISLQFADDDLLLLRELTFVEGLEAHLVAHEAHGDGEVRRRGGEVVVNDLLVRLDRKSTRLNSSHRTISYAVFCLKKKKKKLINET